MALFVSCQGIVTPAVVATLPPCHPALPHVLLWAAPPLLLLLGGHEGDGGDEDHCYAVEYGGEAGGEVGHCGDVSATAPLGRNYAQIQAQLNLSFESLRCGAVVPN